MGFCHLLETEGSRNDVLHKPRVQLGTEMSMKSLSRKKLCQIELWIVME